MQVEPAPFQAFVDTVQNDRKFTIEVRNPTWFEDDVYEVLRGRNIAMCITEQAEFASPVVATAPWGYARLHRLDYDEAALGGWAEKLGGLPWSEAYIYFKHDEGAGSGPPAVGAFQRAFNA